MTAKNDITGAKLQTKPASQAYRDNWDKIFGKKHEQKQEGIMDETPAENQETDTPADEGC